MWKKLFMIQEASNLVVGNSAENQYDIDNQQNNGGNRNSSSGSKRSSIKLPGIELMK